MYVHCCFFTVLYWAKQSTRSLLVGSKLLGSVHWDILLGWHSCHVSVELIWLGAQGGLQMPTPVWIPWKTQNCEMRMRKKNSWNTCTFTIALKRIAVHVEEY